MSTHDPSSASQVSISGPSLADVLAMVSKMPVTPQVQRNMVSAIRALCRVLDRPAQFVPLHTPTLRTLIDGATPGAVGMSPSRWRNVRSDVSRAIRLSGLSVDKAPEQVPLTTAWEHIANLVPNATLRSVLRRFGRFCCGLQLEPDQVGDHTINRYFAYLDLNQLSKTPERTVSDLVRTWNGYVAGDDNGPFAPLAKKTSSHCYTFGWDELPRELADHANRFREDSLKPAHFDDGKNHMPVRPATAEQRDRMLRRLASAEIRGGIDPSALKSLANVVRPENLQIGLQFLIDRNGGQPNKQVFDMSRLALTVARHWSRLPEDQIATIENWSKNFRIPQIGITDTNRERLRQFGDKQVIQGLLTLPETLIARAQRGPVNAGSALLVQKAIALVILTVAPLRLGNLRTLDRQIHFRRAFSVDDPRYQLVIPAGVVKNKVNLEFPVPPRVMEMIELYLEIYQPRLTNGHASALLFPGRSGEPKANNSLRKNINEIVFKELGLRVNPHLFRHLSALLFLRVHPGQYESVRQLLGHKNIQTTINFYAGYETDEALHRFNRVIDGHREDTCDR